MLLTSQPRPPGRYVRWEKDLESDLNLVGGLLVSCRYSCYVLLRIRFGVGSSDHKHPLRSSPRRERGVRSINRLEYQIPEKKKEKSLLTTPKFLKVGVWHGALVKIVLVEPYIGLVTIKIVVGPLPVPVGPSRRTERWKSREESKGLVDIHFRTLTVQTGKGVFRVLNV